MPIHDWTRTFAGIFHALHIVWLGKLQERLNGGLLPDGYYALADQRAGDTGPDVLTLASPDNGEDDSEPTGPFGGGGGAALALADAPVKTGERRVMDDDLAHTVRNRRSITVRHLSDDRIVALIEIVSRGNKSSRAELERFVDEVDAAVEDGCHVLVIDLHPPTPLNPDGIHGLIGGRYGDSFELDPAAPLTAVSYVADSPPTAYVERLAVGGELADMPLFLDPGHYVMVPLADTYAASFAAMPQKYRDAVSRG